MDKLDDFADQANRLLCGVIFAVQSAFLDYYLIYHLGNLWFLWVLADLVVVGVMLYGFVVTYLYKRGHSTRFLPYPCPGDLPLAYSVWAFYSVTLAVRTGILYKSVALNLKTTTFFGPNVLQVSIALAVPFLYFTVKSLSLRPTGFLKQSTEMLIFCEEVLNILDSINLMSILFSSANVTKLSGGLSDAVIAFGCIAFFVPTVNLAVYSVTKYDDQVGMSRIIRAIYVLTALFLVNLPFLVLRLVIWHTSKILSSLFVTKNVVFIFVQFLDIISIIMAQQLNAYQPSEKPPPTPLHPQPYGRNVLPKQDTSAARSSGGDTSRKPTSVGPTNQKPNNEASRRRTLPPLTENKQANVENAVNT